MRNSNELSIILSRKLEPKYTKTYERFLPFDLTLLASYGYFIRDTYKLMESQILEEIINITSEKLKNTDKSIHPVGHLHFNGKARFSSPYLGQGDSRFTKYIMNNKLHCQICDAISRC